MRSLLVNIQFVDKSLALSDLKGPKQTIGKDDAPRRRGFSKASPPPPHLPLEYFPCDPPLYKRHNV